MLISDDQLNKVLLKEGLIDSKKLDEISVFAKKSDLSLRDALIENDIISEESLISLVAKALKLPFISLSKITIPTELYHVIPENIARKQKVIVFKKDDKNIYLAMADPSNTDIAEMISKKTGKQIIPYLTTEEDIDNSLKIYRKDFQKTFNLLISDDQDKLGPISESTPVAKIADLLIEYAYQDKASDIHIEPDEKNCIIRFRIDGVLQDVLVLPSKLHDRIVTRIKVLSKLRTDEHLTPQDGKMRMKLEKENLDIRVSIIPVSDGEKVVLRLLSSRSRRISLVDLGMEKEDLKKVTRAFNKSFGMVLSTGPTGSGKTTSIYAILKILNTREKNITTIEDPVEYRIAGVNQIQVNPKANLNFANGLRSILRQDPNIIFVGEIRDNETAAIAINAALTGHLVLTTLHTNDASTAVLRFMDMKVEPFLLASTINAIIAQRLVRKICDVCKKPIITTVEELENNLPSNVIKRNFKGATKINTYRGEGCKICHNTGYTGRIGIFEVIEVTPKIRKLITDKGDSAALLEQAMKEGMTTMLDDGIKKCLKGETTLEEVIRVTKAETL